MIAATITIKKPGDMTPEGRMEIAQWLRRQSRDLIDFGDRYTEGVFKANYNYTEKGKAAPK